MLAPAQGIYLGFESLHKLPSTELYDLWTKFEQHYDVYRDSTPRTIVQETGSLWTLGNRFIQAAREGYHWAAKHGADYK